MIVNEERDTKAKMPTYKGLEGFKLIDKMGEYVLSLPYLIDPPHPSLAAHSQTCTTPSISQPGKRSPVRPSLSLPPPILTRSTVKVVRKFELNASQVCVSPLPLLLPCV